MASRVATGRSVPSASGRPRLFQLRVDLDRWRPDGGPRGLERRISQSSRRCRGRCPQSRPSRRRVRLRVGHFTRNRFARSTTNPLGDGSSASSGLPRMAPEQSTATCTIASMRRPPEVPNCPRTHCLAWAEVGNGVDARSPSLGSDSVTNRRDAFLRVYQMTNSCIRDSCCRLSGVFYRAPP